jgi:hypothetical protein
MTIAAIIKLVLGLANKLVGFAGDRQLLEAGEAKNAQKALGAALAAVERAQRTANRVSNDPDYRDSVRDKFDQPNKNE